MVGLNADNLKILEFYPYPSVIQYRLAEYSYLFEKESGDIKIKHIFETILHKANSIVGRDLSDNKISFKVLHIPTNREFFIGYKDNIYAIGLKVWQEYNKKIVIENT